jgi:hypothetical protein
MKTLSQVSTDAEEPLPLSDILPTRSRGVVTRKKSASAKRQYIVELYETHSGQWLGLVRAIGPGVQDTGLGIVTEDILRAALHKTSAAILENDTIMKQRS